ncbi:MAG: DUF2934 domain-containing protein [Phycisphaerales bacterium]
MARKEPRKTAGSGKTRQSEKTASSGQGPVGSECAQEVRTAPSQENKPIARPTPTLGHDQIAERAKRLWQQRGCPQGQDEFIWHEAERQLKRESGLE